MAAAAATRPSLQHFLLRQSALNLYRQYVRASRLAQDVSARSSLMEEVRREFVSRRDVTDLHTIKYLVSDGVTRLKQLKGMLNMQRL
jgi:hypothetical protein